MISQSYCLIYLHQTDLIIKIVANLNYIASTIFQLNSNVLSQTCVDIVGYDQVNKFKRFTVVYNFLSTIFNSRFYIYVQIGDKYETLKSLKKNYKSSIWSEREVWDLFGIIFINNSDLRRLLTDYGFKGYPLRKDFPLSGFKELSYSEFIKKITQNRIYLTQNYRRFDYIQIRYTDKVEQNHLGFQGQDSVIG